MLMIKDIKNIVDFNILHKIKLQSFIDSDYRLNSAIEAHEKFLLSPNGKIFIDKYLKILRKRKLDKIVK